MTSRKMLIDGESNQSNVEDDTHYDFDLFVIGAGSGGVRAARFSANFGAKVIPDVGIFFIIKLLLNLLLLWYFCFFY